MSIKRFKHIVIAIYTHPELYPPTVAAIMQLAEISDQVDVVTRNMLVSKWDYPENVNINYVNKEQFTGFEIEKIGFRAKIAHFYNFVKTIKSLVLTRNSDVLLVNDAIPLFASYLIRNTLRKKKVIWWYHNHDVVDMKRAGTLSIMGMAARFEKRSFQFLDVFSLPAKERLQYFPKLKSNQEPVILPNYPLEDFYSKAENQKQNEDSTIKLVFQGSIGSGHGLEEIIGVLHHAINGKKVELHLVGKVRESYLKSIEALVEKHDVHDHFTYHGMKSFAELPFYLSQFDIGLAIHKPYNVTYSTGGTASNKIYEYAASGMPIILFDNAHYRAYLEDFEWTFFTDLTKDSLLHVMAVIDREISKFSKGASKDFHERFNFETVFQEQMLPVLVQLKRIK